MAKTGRPRKYEFGRNKSRDPNRRKMREIVRTKDMSVEEREAHTKGKYQKYLKAEAEKHKRLGERREGAVRITTKREYKEFRAYINKLNKERLDEILNDSEKMWEIFGDRDDITGSQLDEMRAKKKQNKEYISDAEVQKTMEIIYGGYAGQILEEDKEYKNPYEQEN